MNGKKTPIRARCVRGITLGLAAIIFIYALLDLPFLGGGPGFGKTQVAMTVVAFGLVASCCLPLARNAQCLAMLISVIVTFLGAELAARALFAARYLPAVAPHERYLHLPIPGAYHEEVRLPINGGRTIVSRVNRHSMRGEEIDQDAQCPRVIVYGDSFIQATFSDLVDTFAKQLEHSLEGMLESEVEVLNAGVAAYGPDQILRRIEDELHSLRPQLVVVAIFAGNDYGDLTRNKIYRLGTDGQLVENRYRIDSAIYERYRESMYGSVIKKAVSSIFQSRGNQVSIYDLYSVDGPNKDQLLLETWINQGVQEYEDYVKANNNMVTELFVDSYNADVSLTPNCESAQYKRELMEQILARIHQTAVSHSVEPIFVFIPHPIDVCDEYDYGNVNTSLYPDYRKTNLTGFLQQMAESHEMRFVNLFEAFRSNNPRDLYFRFDDHWNDQGQREAASVVADYIFANGLIAIE